MDQVSATVSCEWLHDNQNLEHLIILDASVGSDTVCSNEWIPNSRYFDIKGKFSDVFAEFPNTIPSREQFEKEACELGINNESLIIVYDNKGVYWSPRVWWLFKTFGFDNVAVLDGGLPQWKKLHYETVSTLNSKGWHVGNFKTNYQADRVCYFHQILTISRDENCIILDARSEERFKKIAPEPRLGLRSGTIPNSMSLPYINLLNEYCLKPKAELKVIFNTLKIGDRSLTFSCGSGITACILLLAAEIVGYKKLSVYDGSWTEFGTLTK
ncbi:sulfurtransferase [Flavobacteriales bacterium 33_180_T64]|nr:sulfurtransferase [Flavobacteriales bacterium 33_180_T64]